jgi:hypothetical protein
MLVAAQRDFSIVTDPNQYKQIDVPFFTTGIIDGKVDRLKGGEFLPVAGLKIHLKMEADGYESVLRTFGDGTFYSMEVPPGSYEIWIDEAQLEFLGVTSSPEKLFFTIETSEDGSYVENLNFLLE